MVAKKKDFGGIILNPGCGLNCVFCGGHPKINDIELKEQEISAYKNLQYFKNEGVKKIEISGSDPIEYDKIIEFVRYIKKEGFEFIQSSTHGTISNDSYFLRKLAAAGIDRFRIPIYGSTAKIHDSVTRKQGSFNQIVEEIKDVLKKKVNIEIKISCLIMEQNKNDLLKIVDFVDKLKVSNFYFSIPCLVKKDCFFYVPLKDLGPYIKKLYHYALKVNNQTLFTEIPFCVFGVFNLKNINNTTAPPNLGKYNQPLEKYKTSVPDLPSYRVKKKVNMCNKCKAFNYCDGFFVNDIDKFGLGKIRPIK